MRRERALVQNTFIISIGSMLPKLTTIITLPILTAGLTKTEYGTFDLISTLVSLFLPIVILKLDMGVFRYLIEYRDDDRRKKEVISTSTIFVISVSLVAVFIAFFFLKNIDIETRMLICIYFLVDIIFVVFQQAVRGLSKNFLYSLGAILFSLVNMAGILLLVSFYHKGLVGVLIAMIIANVVVSLILFISAHLYHYFSLSCFSIERLLEMLGYSWPLIPNSLSLWVMNLSDRLIITTFLGVETNAIYAVANKIPNLLTTIQSSFSAAWMENASLTVKDGDTEEYYSKMFDVIFCMLVGITAGLIAISPILFRLLIRGDYEDAYVQMPILFAGMMFSVLSSFMGGIYAAHKRTKSVGVTTIVAAFLNLLIDFIFVKKIGLYAASLSTVISYIFLVVYRMVDVQKFQKMKFNFKQIFFYLLLLLIMGIISMANNWHLNILNFVIGCIIIFVSNKTVICKIISQIKVKVIRAKK